MSHPLPPLTASTGATSWTLDPAMALLTVLLAGGYLCAVLRVRRRGQPWPVGRTAIFLVVGLGSLVVATMSSLATYRVVLFWPAAVANTLLMIVTPMGFALGDPLTLVRRAFPDRLGPWVWRAARGRPARFATFPLVTMVLGVGTPFVLYFTPYFVASLRHPLVREVAWLQLLVTGLLFVLPLMGEDLLPPWCTWPVKAAIAFADGLADAIPAMVIALAPGVLSGRWYADHPRSWGPTVHWDQTIGGTLMLTLTESIGIPLIIAVFMAWSRADAEQAQVIDRDLDAAAVTAAAPTAADTFGPQLDRPWWETEPGGLRGRGYSGQQRER